MSVIVGRTGAIHGRRLRGELRCFFTASAALRGETVRVRVEAYRVADGAAVFVQIRAEEGAVLQELRGSLEGGACELAYTVEPPADRPLPQGAIVLVARAAVEAYGLSAESQQLRVLVPQFSI
jgi:hypothetical protein